MKKKRLSLLSLILVLHPLAAFSAPASEILNSWQRGSVDLDGVLYHLYVADNDQKRQQGLMRVSSMGREEGVLFVFDQPSNQCMWMKNTEIPLKVIYIDVKGNFLNSHQLKPHDETYKCSKGEAKYAIEILSEMPGS